MEVCRHSFLIYTNTRLVSERPHNDTRVILVALVHSYNAVKILLSPLVVIGKSVPTKLCSLHTVSLKIGLIANVEAVFIAKPEEAGIVRIM